MATQADLRRIALALPGTLASTTGVAFSVRDHKGKERGYAWSWKERVDPKKARVPSATVIAVRVDGEAAKQALLSVDAAKFFTEPHYNGYPAVLVRLPAVSVAELRALLTEAHRLMWPRESTGRGAKSGKTSGARSAAKRGTKSAAKPGAKSRTRAASGTGRRSPRR